MTLMFITLKRWAEIHQLTYVTAWRHASTGQIETIMQGRKFLAVVRDPVVLELLAAEGSSNG